MTEDRWTPREIMDRADTAAGILDDRQRRIWAEGRAIKAEATTVLAEAAYETFLIRWRESEAKRQALQEALRAAVTDLERLRASHTPRTRMAAVERSDGLYEYRPQDPWAAA